MISRWTTCAPAKYFWIYFKDFDKKDIVVISPDVGGVERARKFAARMDAGLVIIDKRRPKPNEAVVYNVIGDVKDKVAIILTISWIRPAR